MSTQAGWYAIVHTHEPQTVVLEKLPARLGRGASCELVIADSTISDEHAVLRFDGEHLTITDDSSSNGSTVGSVPLRPRVPRILLPGSQVRLGRVLVEIHRTAPEREGSTVEIALGLLHAAHPAVVVIEGPDFGRTFELRDRAIVGRGSKCEIALSDPSVSLEHIELKLRDRELSATDLGSRHGTRVGSTTLHAQQTARWDSSAVLAIGQTVLGVVGIVDTKRVEIASVEDVARDALAPSLSAPTPHSDEAGVAPPPPMPTVTSSAAAIVAVPLVGRGAPATASSPTSRAIRFALIAVVLFAFATIGWLVLSALSTS